MTHYQTIGRAARNVDGKVILYADKETKSIRKAIKETERRRTIQLEYIQRFSAWIWCYFMVLCYV